MSDAGIAAADAAFARGDYKRARAAYAALAADPALSPDERAHVQKRLAALRVDRVALGFGLITAAVVVFVYVLSRFVLDH
jgi:hypothetical protein